MGKRRFVFNSPRDPSGTRRVPSLPSQRNAQTPRGVWRLWASPRNSAEEFVSGPADPALCSLRMREQERAGTAGQGQPGRLRSRRGHVGTAPVQGREGGCGDRRGDRLQSAGTARRTHVSARAPVLPAGAPDTPAMPRKLKLINYSVCTCWLSKMENTKQEMPLARPPLHTRRV